LAKALEQIIARHAGLAHKRVDLVRSECTGQIVRRYLLIGSGADPRIGRVAMAALLKLFKQVIQAAADDASGSAASKHAAQSAFEQIAKPAAARKCGVSGAAPGHRAGAGWTGRRLTAGKALDRLKGEQAEDRVMGDMPPPPLLAGPRCPRGPFCIPLRTSSRPMFASCYLPMVMELK
jgi:hypothetical protein